MRMKKGTEERLEKLGLDVGFLVWLEGREEKLPRLDRVCTIPGAKLANAIRSAAWLRSQFAHPDRIAPDSPEKWGERYRVLQECLWNAVLYSMTCRKLERARDLRDLIAVTKALLPRQVREQYAADIETLRKRGQPPRLRELVGQVRGQRTGGRRQAEHVQRMRAAVTHIGSKSKNCYRDLAGLWNERFEGANYDPESMRQKLRKGECKGEQVGEPLVEFWMMVYRGDLRAAFPGEFPRSP